jgi:MFS family permease
VTSTPAAQGEERLFVPSYWMAIVAIHCYFISYQMSLVEIPKSLSGQPDWVVGLVVGTLGMAGMLSRPLVGVWVDAGNRQRWLRIGAVATVIAFAGYTLGLGPWLTLPFRALHGIAMGLFTTALLAIVTSMLPAQRRGFGVGVYQSSNTVAALYSAAGAVLLIEHVSFGAAFAVAGAAAALGLLFGMMVGDPQSAGAAVAAARVPLRERRWISRTALLPATVFFTITAPFGAVSAFLPLFADERALGNVGFFYTALAIAQLTARSSSGWLSDRIGRARIVPPSLAIGIVGLLALSAAHTEGTMLIAAALLGLGIAGTQTTIVALIVDRTPREALGSAMATYTMAWDVGGVVGSILLGFVAGATSYGAVFALCAVMPAAGIVLFLARLREPVAPAAVAAPVDAGAR